MYHQKSREGFGLQWYNKVITNENLNLWKRDGIPPSEEGSYLTACEFYAVFFQESPGELPYAAG
jgi:hypothetical protein